MKLQMASRLAVYAVLELAASPDRQLSAAEIGAKYGVSTHHLAKVLHGLKRAGLVRSARGAGGGFRFAGSVKRTTLMDVIEVFERVGAQGSVEGEPGEDSPVGRALGRVLGEIDATAEATLRSVTIATCLRLAGLSQPRTEAA
jgi:Rrf2 family protein